MIPLLMQEGFKAKGWLGLILGQSMYYAFYPNAVPTDRKFTQQMDALIREVGDRGKAKTRARASEGALPRRGLAPAAAFEPTPAPAPAAAVPTTPSRELAPTSTPDHGFSPSVQLSPSMPMVQPVTSAGGGGSFSEMSSFFMQQREEAKAERAEMEARQDAKDARMEGSMEQQRKEMEAKMHEQQAALRAELTPRPPAAAITLEKLAALQARVEALHAAELLADEERFALEDTIADWAEASASAAEGRVITQTALHATPALGAGVAVHKMIKISEVATGDAAFARQLRRKFVSM